MNTTHALRRALTGGAAAAAFVVLAACGADAPSQNVGDPTTQTPDTGQDRDCPRPPNPEAVGGSSC
jgi:hypothetical protein